MQSSHDQAFAGSAIQNSTAIASSLNGNHKSVLVAGNVTTLHYYEGIGPQLIDVTDTQESQVSDHSTILASHPKKAVGFVEPPSKPPQDPEPEVMEIPPYISRLITKRDAGSTTVYPTVSTSHSQRTTITNASSRTFMAVADTPSRVVRSVGIKTGVIRNYMQSNFFFEGNAIPLWKPAPGDNCREIFKESNICVGDVGVFTYHGQFQVLFNVFLSYADNQDLGFVPPDGFQEYGSFKFSDEVSEIYFMSDYNPLSGDFKHSEVDTPSTRKCVGSYRLCRRLGIQRRSGNILKLPNGVWCDRMHLRTLRLVGNYIKREAPLWYRYYNDQPEGPSISKNCLRIIMASYKCDTWGLATCSTGSPDDISARLYRTYQHLNVYHDWEAHYKVVGKTGPYLKGTDATAPLTNQCVAVEVYSIEERSSVQTFASRFSFRNLSTLSLSLSSRSKC